MLHYKYEIKKDKVERKALQSSVSDKEVVFHSTDLVQKLSIKHQRKNSLIIGGLKVYLYKVYTVTYTVNRMYDVPEIEINFDDWYKASNWLWPKSTSSLDNDFDTVFQL